MTLETAIKFFRNEYTAIKKKGNKFSMIRRVPDSPHFDYDHHGYTKADIIEMAKGRKEAFRDLDSSEDSPAPGKDFVFAN